MPSLDSYFQSHGKSFDSYSQWLGEATPEELLLAGVRPGILIDLYGPGNENISEYADKSHRYFSDNGFSLLYTKNDLLSRHYFLDRNKAIRLSANYSFGIGILMTSPVPSARDQELTKDISQIVRGLINFIQEEKISSRLIPSDAADIKYEIKNYVMDPGGFRIFQTDKQ